MVNNIKNKPKKSKKGFTLIELIVVMAVIGILVLVAAPKFIGYTQKAELTKIQNDSRAIGTMVDAHLVGGEELSGTATVSDMELNVFASEGKLYDLKGPVESARPGTYTLLSKDFTGDSKLKGDFYANDMGDIYYVGTKAIGGGSLSTKAPGETESQEATDESYFTFSGGTITGYSDEGPKSVVIPSEIEGVAVTTIGDFAFAEKGLTSLVIPNGVTTIGENAFLFNFSIGDLVIPDSVTNIGYSAFSGAGLTSVVLPNSITEIRGDTFAGNFLSNVTIPDSVTTVGNYAFMENSLLTSVTINNPVTSIGMDAFYQCGPDRDSKNLIFSGAGTYTLTGSVWTNDDATEGEVLSVEALQGEISWMSMMYGEAEYTPESYAVFSSAILSAEDVVNSGAPTQQEIEDAITILNSSALQLTLKAWEELSVVRFQAEVDWLMVIHEESAYTPESWSIFESAIVSGGNVINPGTATLQEFNEVMASLGTAVGQLVLVGQEAPETTTPPDTSPPDGPPEGMEPPMDPGDMVYPDEPVPLP